MEKIKRRKIGPGRPRSTGNSSFGDMGLEPDEDKLIKEQLEKLDLSLKQVKRALFRQWIDQGFPGFIMFKGNAVGIGKAGK